MCEQNAAGVSKFKYKGSKGLAYLKLGSGQLQAMELRQHPREEKDRLSCVFMNSATAGILHAPGLSGRIGIKEDSWEVGDASRGNKHRNA